MPGFLQILQLLAKVSSLLQDATQHTTLHLVSTYLGTAGCILWPSITEKFLYIFPWNIVISKILCMFADYIF